jgi:DNA adenine methylase
VADTASPYPIRENGLSDGLYVEPYAGGASVAWELLITGVVRRIAVNEISRPLHAFWKAVLTRTEELCSLIERAELSVAEWDRCKRAMMQPELAEELLLAYSFFFLNRTNRSGILNGALGR